MSDSPNKKPLLNDERTFWMSLSVILLIVILFLIRQMFTLSNPAAPSDNKNNELAKISFVYKTIASNYETAPDTDKLYKAAINAMLESLDDPYSIYMEQTASRSIQDTINGNFGGIGVSINKKTLPEGEPASSPEEYYIRVVGLTDNSPAYSAGVRYNDYITAIEGDSVVPLSSEEVVSRLRGKIGSKVTITVLRDDVSFDVSIKRGKIEIQTIKSALIQDRIGYIKILEFTPQTPSFLNDAVKELLLQQASSFVLDLRGNGGGSYDAAVAIADDFLDDGTIVSTVSRNSRNNMTEKARRTTLIPMEMPVIVLLDHGSASASEILAGALKDNKRAVLIGSTSYGKAKVQNVYNLNAEHTETFKITTASYYTPDGQDINGEGITPDIPVSTEVPLTEENKQSYQQLYSSDDLENFYKTHPSLTDQDFNLFVRQQRAKGNVLPDNYLKQQLLYYSYRQMESPPVFDLRFDLPLQKAVEELLK